MNAAKQNILLILFIAVVIAFVYIWYSYLSNRPPSAVVSQNPYPAGVGAGRPEFTTILESLKTVRLDLLFFEDPTYKSLVDSEVEIVVPIEHERPNPFAPIGQ